MAIAQKHISIMKDQLMDEISTKPFDEINPKLTLLKPDVTEEVFLGTTSILPEKKSPSTVTGILVCQSSFISGYVVTDATNMEFRVTATQMKNEIQNNPESYTNVSLDKYNQIKIVDELSIPYIEQFSDDEIENIKNCAKSLDAYVLIRCYSYEINDDDTITVSLHDDFNKFIFHNRGHSFPLPSPLKHYNGKLVTCMANLFNSCQAKSLDLSNFDTSNITDMSHMFEGTQVNSLNVSSFDTSLVTNMSFMFSSCQALDLDVSKFNTFKVTDMSYMFYSCQAKELDLSNFDTSNTIDISKMFCGCQAQSIDTSSFNTSKVIDMSRMFKSCQVTELELSNFDTSNVENMSSMFSSCLANNITLESFNTSKVTNMTGMFYSCQAKTLDISNFDTSNVTFTDGMFDNFNNTIIK